MLRAARRARALGARDVDERQRQRPRARPRPDGDQAERRRLPRADAGLDGGHRPARRTRRRRPRPVVGHVRPRLHLPRDAGRERRRPHPQHLRHRLGGARRGDPVRAHGDGRRVRRRDPDRPLRPHRRRRHRRGGGVDPARAPLARRAAAQPRRVRRRRDGRRRRQGGRDVRGRGAHRPRRQAAGRTRRPSTPPTSTLLYARYQHAYGQGAADGEHDELVRAPPDLVPDREPAPLRRRDAAPGGGPVGARRRAAQRVRRRSR